MSDRRRSDRPLPPAPHPENNGNGEGSRIGLEAEGDENNQQGTQEVLMAPSENEYIRILYLRSIMKYV